MFGRNKRLEKAKAGCSATMREYLDKVLKEIQQPDLGEPDMFLISVMGEDGKPEGEPVRIYKNVEQLYRNMDYLSEWYACEDAPLMITAGWFDEE